MKGHAENCDVELVNKREQPTVMKASKRGCYGLWRLARSVSTWNARLNESIRRDIKITILDFAHYCRTLWSLFDNESDFEKITLWRIEKMVKSYMGDADLPPCEQALVEGEEVDVLGL